MPGGSREVSPKNKVFVFFFGIPPLNYVSFADEYTNLIMIDESQAMWQCKWPHLEEENKL